MIVFGGIFYYFYDKTNRERWKFLPFLLDIQGFTGLFLTQWLIFNRLTDFPLSLRKYGRQLRSAGDEIFKRIQSECKITTVLCLFSSFAVVITALLHSPFVGDEATWQYLVHLTQDCSYNIKLLFYLWYEAVFIFGALSLLPLFNISIYNLAHVKFQYQLLNAIIVKLGNWKVHHINDVRYQERIAKHLKICIKMQLQIVKLCHVGEKFAHYVINSMCLFGVNILVYSMFFIALEISPISNFRMYMCVFDWIVIIHLFCTYGQSLTEETENIFSNLCKLQWEHWNNQNRRTLVIMLINAGTPYNLTGEGFITVNYQLIVKMWRLANAVVFLIGQNMK
ncbi:uncharacterized protein [Leptinotarsa decemlineata]|uniref:uncharacterized protein n=1 Tax=Leptinotarsa decemlineata TaxID=7539 RepID=UPI003D30AAF8